MSSDTAAPDHATVRESTVRIARNTGWLLGGRGVGGVLSLVYLAVAARTLGPSTFGLFALVLTYGQAIVNLVQFQPWQVVVQYGAGLVERRDSAALAKLVRFCFALDIGSILFGAAVAVIGLHFTSTLLGWSPDVRLRALLFALVVLAAPQSTPTGVLRLLDRYDLATVADTMTPITRFVGAVGAALIAPDLDGFLVAWALSEVASATALWFFAIRELRRRHMHPFASWSLAGVTVENPGLWRFAWLSNLGATVSMVWLQIGTLAVGWIGGAAVAGGYRLAYQFAQAVAKPVTLLARSIYPEFARLRHVDRKAVRAVLTRTTLYALVGSALLVGLVALLGRPFLGHVIGPEYLAAYLPLVLLTGAAAFNLIGVGFEPALVAFGRPGTALAVRSLGAAIYLALLVPLLREMGAVGAAWSAVAAGGVVLIVMGASVGRFVLRSPAS